jgi:hypothetical protein
MEARYVLAVLAVFGLTAGCSESKLRAGHCERDTDCPSGQVCVLEGATTFTCAAPDGGLPDGDAMEVAPECTTSSQCPAEKPICDAQTCRACDSARPADGAACASRDGTRPFCGPSGACVECVSATSADCTANPAKPICDPSSNTCVGCATDDQCVAKGVGPGLCMSHQDGRCASDSEVIYVENKGGCASSVLTPMAGSSGTPFCGPQIALDGLTPSRRVLVISGPVAGLQWNAAGANPISLIGRASAAIVGGLQSGISFSGAGELFARDIVVRRSDAAGIAAQNGAVLRLEHVTVDSNGGGGILVDGAAFDIRNTTITANGPGQSGATAWGGMLATNVLASGPANLELVTIRNNNPVGLACSGPVSGTGVLATDNTSINIATSCALTACTPAGPTCGAP